MRNETQPLLRFGPHFIGLVDHYGHLNTMCNLSKISEGDNTGPKPYPLTGLYI